MSPPPLSSRWERKLHFSEASAAHNCMPLHRTSFSSSRSYRSNSSSAAAAPSHHRHETANGLLAIFNSPSESFRYSQRSLDDIADPIAMPSDPSLRRSVAFSSQESTSSGSFGTASQKALEDSEDAPYNRQTQNLSTCGLLMSKTGLLSRQNLDPSASYAGGSISEVASMELEFLRQRIRNSVDVLPSYAREKTDSWRMRAFSELMESSHQRSARWSNIDISSDSFADASHEDFIESYVGSLGAVHCQDLRAASHSEVQKCGLCAKEISQKSPWSFSRIPGSKELPVVGILDCGHVYHAECLDQATPLMHAHDPPCPRCDVEKRFQIKVQGESTDNLKTIGLTGHASIKGKLSRVGVAMEDFTGLGVSCKNSQPSWNHPSSSECSSRKGVVHPSVRSAERNFSTKSLLKKQFSFRGKLSRDPTISSSGSKRPGYPARVSPENSIREDNPMDNKRKIQSSAFGFGHLHRQ